MTADSVTHWLDDLGLGQYASVFTENAIDLEVLPELTEADLESLGVLLGHRKKILKAIAGLAAGPDGATVPPEALPTAGPQGPSPAVSEAERRQLTVMFCDLVGSTQLSRRLDPEDLREVMRSYQDAVAGAVTRYGGYVAKFLGDGVLAYFGWPQAHEDQAERAVRTGLDAVAAVSRLVLDNDVSLQARVGIATGRVVVGDLVGESAAEAEAVAGETPNLAARLEGVAAPGQVVIGPLTRELVGEAFELEDLGGRELKGFDESVRVWRVLREGEIDSRYEAKHVGGALPLVGRQEELGLLLRSWQASKEGRGQVVLIQGEAGIGKSRLVEALREHLAGEGYLWVAHRCSPYHANSTLYPVIEHLKRAMGWKPDDGAETRLEKLEAAVETQSLPPEEAVPLYAELMSLPLPQGRYAPLGLSAKERRDQTLDALAAWLLEEAERTAVLNLWEDLHWVDPTTLELLALYIDQSPTVAMMNLLTYRPEFAPPWSMRSHMTPITLNRLERPEVKALIGHQAKGKEVPSEVIEHVVGKADGVPLYVEELTKSILESDYLREEADRYALIGSLSEVSIPATLQDSLMARLDRLPRVRELAQLGAVIGREFAYQMLQSLVPLDEPLLHDGLGQLVDNELLYQRGRPPRSRYIFKHALIQDAAYQSLLKRTRQKYHRQVAALLDERFPETVQAHPELVAHHYTEAGMTKEALDYWYLAGEYARWRSANHEAVAHLRKGLSLMRELPDERGRVLHELKLQFSLGGAYLQMVGHSAPEVETAFVRARELCRRVGDAPELVPTLFGLWRTYVVQLAGAEKPKDIAAELTGLAEKEGSAVSRVVAHYAEGFTAYVMGRFSVARDHLREGIRLYSPEDRDTAAVYRFGQDPGVACCCYLALVEWTLGCPDQALGRARDGIALARRLDDPFSVAFSHAIASFLDQARGDSGAALEKADEAVRISTEKGYPYWAGIGRVMRGWSEAAGNPTGDTLRAFKDQIAHHRAVGTDLFAPYFLNLLGDVMLGAQDAEGCMAALEEAEQTLSRTGERSWESETHRLFGEILVARGGDSTKAEGRFEKALAVARRSEARSLELRAALGLARLWQRQGRRQDARELLVPLHDGFAEGFETADLRDAKALIDELS
jgi:class 3 adenylate cyclase/predicted ATPase